MQPIRWLVAIVQELAACRVFPAVVGASLGVVPSMGAVHCAWPGAPRPLQHRRRIAGLPGGRLQLSRGKSEASSRA